MTVFFIRSYPFHSKHTLNIAHNVNYTIFTCRHVNKLRELHGLEILHSCMKLIRWTDDNHTTSWLVAFNSPSSGQLTFVRVSVELAASQRCLPAVHHSLEHQTQVRWTNQSLRITAGSLSSPACFSLVSRMPLVVVVFLICFRHL